MKKKVHITTILLGLLFLSILAPALLKFGSANPYLSGGETEPPFGAKPPLIMLASQENNTVLNVNHLYLCFNATVGDSKPVQALYNPDVQKIISDVHIKGDWFEDNFTLYCPETNNYGVYLDYAAYECQFANFSQNLTNIPDGNHSLVIYVTETGRYEGSAKNSLPVLPAAYAYQYTFHTTSYLLINFLVDKPPLQFTLFRLITKAIKHLMLH